MNLEKMLNMKTNFLVLSVLMLVMVLSCGNTRKTGQNGTMVLITTDFGSMKVKLYDETPLHRDNFLKLAGEGYYNDLLFHRVIKEFMLQGGDPDSRGASASKRLGGGGPSYQVDAEIKPEFFHKKGALAAARQGDNVNPERKSSGSQFYIVHGKVHSPEELTQMEEQQKMRAVRQELMTLYRQNQALVSRWQQESKTDSINALMVSLQEQAEQNANVAQFQISEERRAAYTSIGGTPFLDGSYTVFGEVVEGFEVIDSIANQQIGQADRPLHDIKMKVEVIK
jgi:cyclophilin family peptidyl-prolyl cis-trans isomerase